MPRAMGGHETNYHMPDLTRNGKVTITDNEAQESFTISVTETDKETGALDVEAEGYGKGTLMAMTVADYIGLEESPHS